jgi:peptidoglycan/LPS O-acetylase OafA/YrhL
LTRFYLSLGLGATLIVLLSRVDAARLPTWATRLDRHLGDLSYPIFLAHYGVGVAVSGLVYGGTIQRGGTLLATSAVLLHVVAVVLHRIIDGPVNRLRDSIRT